MDILKRFENYLKENYHYEPDGENNTIINYLSDVEQFIKFFKTKFGEDIVVFSRGHLIEYKQNMLKEKGYKYTTINRKIASLSIYENFLIDAEIKKDEKKVIKKKDYYNIVPSFITADMMPRNTIKKVRVGAADNARDYLIFIILNEGGLRVSELINIELKRDVNLDTRKIMVLGKGNKAREIFINNIMYDAIIEYLPIREEMLKGRFNKYLIISNKTANTNKPMGRTSINNILTSYCNKVKENKINPHIMRHDCATSMYEEGYTDMMLKKALGQNSNVTNKYVHPGGEQLRRNKA